MSHTRKRSIALLHECEVSIPSFTYRDGQGQVVFYQVRFCRTVQDRVITDVVFRRYSEFLALHTVLRQNFPQESLPTVPGKKLFGNLDASFVSTRQSELEQFIKALVGHKNEEVWRSEALVSFMPVSYGRCVHRTAGWIKFQATEAARFAKKPMYIFLSPVLKQLRLCYGGVVTGSGAFSREMTVPLDHIISISRAQSNHTRCDIAFHYLPSDSEEWPSDHASTASASTAASTSTSTSTSTSSSTSSPSPLASNAAGCRATLNSVDEEAKGPPEQVDSSQFEAMTVVEDHGSVLEQTRSRSVGKSFAAPSDFVDKLGPAKGYVVDEEADAQVRGRSHTEMPSISSVAVKRKSEIHSRQASSGMTRKIYKTTYEFLGVDDRERFYRTVQDAIGSSTSAAEPHLKHGGSHSNANSGGNGSSSGSSSPLDDHPRLRVFCTTWNMARLPPNQSFSEWLPRPNGSTHYDLIVVGVQECSLSIGTLSDQVMEAVGPSYIVSGKKALWEIKLIVLSHVSLPSQGLALMNVEADSVPTGIMGLLGNKGGVGVSCHIGHHSLCFVNCHLAPKQEQFDNRNRMFHEICNSLKIGDPQLDFVRKFDTMLWMGDLNYRVDMPLTPILVIIERERYEKMFKYDQYRKAQEQNLAFVGFEEVRFLFLPLPPFSLS